MKLLGIYGLFWLIYYVVGVIVLRRFLSKKSIFLRLISILLGGVLLPAGAIYLTHDVPVVAYLKDKYCRENMVEIKETVEFPGSVYWEDNVVGGFSADNRHWMVAHYLDGIHLQTLALNGDDGNIYVYHATEKDFVDSTLIGQEVCKLGLVYQDGLKLMHNKSTKDRDTFRRDMQPNLQQQNDLSEKGRAQRQKEISTIVKNGIEFSKQNFFSEVTTNYIVKKIPLPLPSWQEEFVHTDKIVISEQQSEKVIGIANRMLRYRYKLDIDIVHPTTAKVGYSVCGLGKLNSFDEDVLFPYANLLRAKVSRNTPGTKPSKFDYIVGN